MKLQIAVDNADMRVALDIAEKVHAVVDIFECGTPVLMREGIHVVRAVKERYPDLTVLADSKIMDGGAIECADICEAGADIVTVLAVSDDATIKEVVDTAHKYGRKVMADLMCIHDIAGRSTQLVETGVDVIAVHTGVDQQAQGRTPLGDLRELVGAIEPARAAVAGGVKMSTIADYVALRPGIVIAGGALYKAPDVRAAAVQMKGALA